MNLEVSMSPFVIPLGAFAMVICIVLFSSLKERAVAQYRSQVQSRLVERFGTAEELRTFLASPEGKRFLQEEETERPRREAGNHVRKGIFGAIIVFSLGVPFLFLSFFLASEDRAMLFFLIPGSILICLGLGIFLATIISLKLSRSIGNQEPADREP